LYFPEKHIGKHTLHSYISYFQKKTHWKTQIKPIQKHMHIFRKTHFTTKKIAKTQTFNKLLGIVSFSLKICSFPCRA
jgi:hypothetical protein